MGVLRLDGFNWKACLRTTVLMVLTLIWWWQGSSLCSMNLVHTRKSSSSLLGGCLGLIVSGTTRLLTPNTDGAPSRVRTLDWTSAQYDFLYFDGCTPSDTYWLTLITQAFWYPFWLLAFGVHPVPLYHNSDVESGGSCGTIPWCISLCGLPFC